MVNNREIARLLQEGIEIEEKIIEVYADVGEGDMFIGCLEDQEKTGVRELLTILLNDSKIHKQWLEELIQKYKK